MEVVINLDKHTAERAAYWLVIIVLSVLLVFSYLGGDEDKANGAVVKEPAAAAAAAPEAPAAQAEVAAESCSDGVLNQDETGIDCGGSCGGCFVGEACETDDDCRSGYCDAGECAEEPEESSGELEVAVLKVLYDGGEDRTAKITGLEVEVVNGLSEPARLQIEVYPKSGNGVYYLNVFGDAEIDGGNAYAVVELPIVAAGDTFSDSVNVDGPYLYSASGYYDAGDDFSVEFVVVDERTGRDVSTFERTVRV